MGPYDARHITLDPGLTALALRGIHEREGHYPFVERFRRRRAARRSLAGQDSLAQRTSEAPAAASSWRDLLRLGRPKRVARPAAAPAPDAGLAKRVLPLAS
jgi:hypothetical protein